MKILFMIPTLSVGGAEKVLVNLVNNMNRESFDITVLTLFDGGVNKQFLKPWIKYKTCFKRSFKGNSHILKIWSPEKLFGYFVHEKYDVIVSYLEGSTARIVSGCPDLNVKLVSWIHVEQHTKECASKAFRSFNEAKKCYQKFDQTICVSQFVKDDFQSIFSLENPIDVLYNTNESAQIIQKSQETIEANLFFSEEFNLIGVGKLIENKGFDRIIKIGKRLLEDGYPIHIYILGIGSEKENLEKYAIQNHMEKQFTLLGYQTNPYKYVAKADLFVCTSYAEGFSTAATEALIVGTPVCTVEVSGMKEMLGKNNEYGIITKNDDEALYQGIKRLLDDTELLDYYREQAEIRGKDFSTEKTVVEVEIMLKKVVENNYE